MVGMVLAFSFSMLSFAVILILSNVGFGVLLSHVENVVSTLLDLSFAVSALKMSPLGYMVQSDSSSLGRFMVRSLPSFCVLVKICRGVFDRIESTTFSKVPMCNGVSRL